MLHFYRYTNKYNATFFALGYCRFFSVEIIDSYQFFFVLFFSEPSVAIFARIDTVQLANMTLTIFCFKN